MEGERREGGGIVVSVDNCCLVEINFYSQKSSQPTLKLSRDIVCL